MRPELEKCLRTRFPSLYPHREGHREGRPQPFSQDLGDGWFAIQLALSGVLDRHLAQADLGQFQVLEVGPQRGALHFHASGQDQFMRGAIDAASNMSLAVSSLSGRPGTLMVDSEHRHVTLAPGELDNCQPAPAHTMRDAVVPVGAGNPRSLKLLGQRRGHLVAQDIDVPPGWSDVVNVLLAAFSKSPGRIDWVRGWYRGLVGQLVVSLDAKRSHAYQLGAVAFAANVAAFVDPVTGACGPVDDSGLPEWWQRLAGSHAALPDPWGTYDASGLWCSCIDSYIGPISGHPAGSLIVAAHHEAGSIQFSVKPSVAHTMRENARRHGGIGCAALLAEVISLPSARPPADVETCDGGAESATYEARAANVEALVSIHHHASAARSRLAMAAAAARGTVHEEAIRASCRAIDAFLDDVNRVAGLADLTPSGC